MKSTPRRARRPLCAIHASLLLAAPLASCVQGGDTDTTAAVTPVNSVITVELKYENVASVTISPVIG